jgi:NTP pyrophosphatase (non-canonical NTP hydrolase)
MTFDEYQKKAKTTAQFASDLPSWVYLALGLTSESGEVADKLKKIIRNKAGKFTDDDKAEIRKELGDVLWYVALMADELGFTLEDVAQTNLNKLFDRVDRDVIRSTGDNR